MQASTLSVKPVTLTGAVIVALLIAITWGAIAAFVGEVVAVGMIVFSAVYTWASLNFTKFPGHAMAVNAYRRVGQRTAEHLNFALAIIAFGALIFGALCDYGVFYGAVVVMYIVAEVMNFARMNDIGCDE